MIHSKFQAWNLDQSLYLIGWHVSSPDKKNSHNHKSVNSSIGMNSFDLKSSLLPNIHRERVLASQKVGPTYSIPYLICINPLFHLIVLHLAYYVHVFTSVFSLPLRQ